MKNFFLHLIFVFIGFSISFSQNQYGLPFVRIYMQKDFNAHFQNWDAAQTQEGLMLIANGDGILSYDGVHWDLFPIGDNFVPRRLKFEYDNNLYVCGYKSFGKITIDTNGRLKYKEIYNCNNNIWDFFVSKDFTYLLTDTFLTIISPKDTTFLKDSIFYRIISDSKGNLYTYNRSRIYKISANSKILQRIQTTSNDHILIPILINDTVMFLTDNSQLYFIEDGKLIWYKNSKLPIKDNRIQNIIYKNSNYFISTYNNGLIILNEQFDTINHLNTTNVLPSNTIYNIFIDRQDNIWCTSNVGIFYIDFSSPVRIIDKIYSPLISNPGYLDFIDSILYTNAGYNFMTIVFKKKNPNIYIYSNLERQTWRTTKIGKNIYIATNPRIIKIDAKGNFKALGPNENVWDIVKVPFKKDEYLVGTSMGLYVYQAVGDSLTLIKKIDKIKQRVRNYKFDAFNNLWFPAVPKGVYKLRFTPDYEIEKLTLYDENKGLTNSTAIKFFEWFNTFFISTYKTLFIYDYLRDSIYEYHKITDKFNTKGKNILQLVGIDNKKNLWFEYHNEYNKVEIFCLTYQNGDFVEIYRSARRLYENGVGELVNIDNQHLFLSLTEFFAVYRYLPDNQNLKFNYYPLITKVNLIENDSTIYYGFSLNSDSTIMVGQRTSLFIKYKDRNIRLFFALPDYIYPQGTMYRYKLENYDNKWSLWTFENKKDYTNLPPGTYTFVVEAKNIFNNISEKTKFTFTIQTPWYRTVLAYFVYSLLILSLFLLILWLYTRSLRLRNIKLQKIVEERTHELVMKNAELEQQKEEILTQAEELNIANQQLEKFSTIIRETDNAIILMDKEGNFIWANPAYTRIFGYTLDELITQISPNIISANTPENIQEIIKECINQKKTVKYEINLKNKKGNEIWIHTTLTPILDDENNITDLVAIDADITPIKQAYKLLEERETIIEANIRYASTIQQSILPSKQDIDKFFNSYIIYKPKDIVSGDFYWISNLFKTVDGRLTHDRESDQFKVGNTIFFAVFDCTGHGVPGAFMSLIANHLISEMINSQRIEQPKDILAKLDVLVARALKRQNENSIDGMTVSLCRFDKVLDDDRQKIVVVFAGSKQHITYYKYSTNQFYRIRGCPRQIAFTINPNIEFIQEQFELDLGDILLMYTDGLKDLNNINRNSFTHSQIIRIIEQNLDKNIEQIGQILDEKSSLWVGEASQRDDIAFVILQMK